MILRLAIFNLLLILTFSCNNPSNKRVKTFKYNLSTPISTLDPAFAKVIAQSWVGGHVYETLFEFDSSAQLKPLLCDSFTLNADKMTYTFFLKNKVYFHQNQCFKNYKDSIKQFTAQDVVYSLSRLIDPETATPGAWILNNQLDSVEPFKVVDSLTLQIKLKEPNSQFVKLLAIVNCSIIPKEAVEFYGSNFRANPVGTGAFQFMFWDEGDVLFFKKNERYHQTDNFNKRLPYLDYIKITFNEQKKLEWFSFLKGDLSFVTTLDPTMLQYIFEPSGELKNQYKTNYKCYIEPYLNTEYMALIVKDSLLAPQDPLKHLKVRQAVNYALDRKKIVKYLKQNLAIPAEKGFVPFGMPNYNIQFEGYTFKPQLAKQLLNEINQKHPKIEIHINNNYIDLAEYIASQLNAVGFEVQIQLHPADVLSQLASQGSINFFRRSWIADYPDAENYFACFYSKNGVPPNYTRFQNKEYDLLYESLKRLNDPQKTNLAYQRMEQILFDNSPYVALFYDQSIRIVQKNISGLKQNSLNLLNLKGVNLN